MSPLKPNLFIIGAMKSGTTSLHNYLSTHSDIFMSQPKELWYFVEEKNWHKGENWYLSHFQGAKHEKYRGESSADYTMYPKYQGVPKRMYEFNPSACLIYIMRDPVERAISHYWYDVHVGYERRPIQDAIFSERKYIDYSNYAMQLKQYYEYFSSDKFYIDTFENLKSFPISAVSNILHWLELDQNDWKKDSLHTYNPTPEIIERVKGRGMLHKIRYSRFWDLIHPCFPQVLVRTGKAIAYTKVKRSQNTPTEVREYLRENLQDSTRDLAVMLKRDLSEWKSFNSI